MATLRESKHELATSWLVCLLLVGVFVSSNAANGFEVSNNRLLYKRAPQASELEVTRRLPRIIKPRFPGMLPKQDIPHYLAGPTRERDRAMSPAVIRDAVEEQRRIIHEELKFLTSKPITTAELKRYDSLRMDIVEEALRLLRRGRTTAADSKRVDIPPVSTCIRYIMFGLWKKSYPGHFQYGCCYLDVASIMEPCYNWSEPPMSTTKRPHPKPTTSTKRPQTSTTKRTTTKRPTTARPATTSKRPATTSRKPSTTSRKPTTSSRRPTSEWRSGFENVEADAEV